MKHTHIIRLFALSALLLAVGSLSAHALSIHSYGESQRIRAEHFEMTFESGAELGNLRLFDGGEWYSVLAGRLSPEFEIIVEGQTLVADSSRWHQEQSTISNDHIMLRHSNQLHNVDGERVPWTLELIHEIYPEGALFMRFILAYHSAEPVQLESIKMSMPVPESGKFLHFSDQQVSNATPALLPLRFLIGMDPASSFTNELELFIEDSLSPARSPIEQVVNQGRVEWLMEGPAEPVSSGRMWGFRYENRIAMAFTRAAADASMSESIGARIFHWVNFLDLDDWHPSEQELAEMADLGATHLILHHEWMRYRGSNGYPSADYTILRDEGELRRTVASARNHGMKVLLYIRGVETFSLNAPIFQDRELYDGIYVDWHGAYAHSHHDAIGTAASIHGDRHFSADGTFVPGRGYFLFNRQMRELVGPKGSLMGHPGSFNTGVMMNLNFDGYLAGETSSERELFVSRDHAVRLGMMASTVTMAWPEEASVFHEPEGVAKMAAWGIVPHVILGLENTRTGNLFPRSPHSSINKYIYQYWNVLRQFDFSDVVILNHPAARGKTIASSDTKIEVLGYLCRSSGDILVFASNLGEASASSQIKLPDEVIDGSGKWSMKRIDIESGEAIQEGTTNGQWQTPSLQQWEFTGYLLTPIDK
jgi:hypothetical protein